MKKKTLRSARTTKSAASARRSPRRAAAQAQASKPARPVARKKAAAKKKAVRRAPRARKAVPPPATPPAVVAAEAALAAQTLTGGFQELAAPPPTLGGLVRQVQAAQPPPPLPPVPAPTRRHTPPPPGQRALPIPPILLEGDERTQPVPMGPIEKFALGPTPPPAPPATPASVGERALPETYGTGKLYLTARDPHCLYAHWDFTEAQQRRQSAYAHHLALRVYQDNLTGHLVTEMPLEPEARHGFVRVAGAGATYVAQLGGYQPGGDWMPLASSEPTATPPETVAEDKTVRWAAVPPLVPAPETRGPERPAPAPAAPPAPQAVSLPAPQFAPPPAAMPSVPAPVAPQLYAEPVPVTPIPEFREREFRPVQAAPMPVAAGPEWTPAQERVLAEVVEIALAQQRTVGSVEVAELAQRRIWREVQVLAAQAGASLPPGRPLPLGGPASLPAALERQALGIFSPAGGAPPPGRQFWFNLNVEVVVYGATEPDARVTLGGQPLRLRPDGTFSCRFSLPDGRYDLAAVAVSAYNEARRAEVTLGRHTDYHDQVGVHPQDQALRPPTPEHIPAAQTT